MLASLGIGFLHHGGLRYRLTNILPLAVCFALSAAVPIAIAAEEPKAAEKKPAAAAKRDKTQSELDQIARDIVVNSERQRVLEREISRLKKDRTTLTAALLISSQKSRQLETSVSETAKRLTFLRLDEERIGKSLQKRKHLLSDLLAALQKMGRKPPPALFVRPDDALAALRSAMLVSGVVPQVRLEADTLAADLSELAALRRETQTVRQAMATDLTALAEERHKTELLIGQKRKQFDRSAEILKKERQKAAELAKQASSLKDLIARMEAQIGAAKQAAKNAAAADEKNKKTGTVSKKQKLALLKNPNRLAPAIPFHQAKGYLRRPAHGVGVRGFGEEDNFGTAAQGMSIATRVGAGVSAPCDGWVVYAGPFRSYGQLLILNAGGGYHVLLAGMNRIDVELGQFVLTGEPVATMGTRHYASATTLNVGSSQPVLYVEFRKDGTSIDPAPWWAAPNDEKVRG